MKYFKLFLPAAFALFFLNAHAYSKKTEPIEKIFEYKVDNGIYFTLLSPNGKYLVFQEKDDIKALLIHEKKIITIYHLENQYYNGLDGYEFSENSQQFMFNRNNLTVVYDFEKSSIIYEKIFDKGENNEHVFSANLSKDGQSLIFTSYADGNKYYVFLKIFNILQNKFVYTDYMTESTHHVHRPCSKGYCISYWSSKRHSKVVSESGESLIYIPFQKYNTSEGYMEAPGGALGVDKGYLDIDAIEVKNSFADRTIIKHYGIFDLVNEKMVFETKEENKNQAWNIDNLQFIDVNTILAITKNGLSVMNSEGKVINSIEQDTEISLNFDVVSPNKKYVALHRVGLQEPTDDPTLSKSRVQLVEIDSKNNKINYSKEIPIYGRGQGIIQLPDFTANSRYLLAYNGSKPVLTAVDTLNGSPKLINFKSNIGAVRVFKNRPFAGVAEKDGTMTILDFSGDESKIIYSDKTGLSTLWFLKSTLDLRIQGNMSPDTEDTIFCLEGANGFNIYKWNK